MKTKMQCIIAAFLGAAAAAYSATVLESLNFDSDPLGAKPPSADNVSPSSPGADIAVEVVGGITNVAGTGHGVRLYDDSASSMRCSWDFVAGAGAQLSAVRVDFTVAQLNSIASTGDDITAAFSEYGALQSSSARLFSQCRLKDDGTVDFVSADGGSDFSNSLNASDNEVSIFANDYDTDTVTYTGPDNNQYVLQTNSVHYWINGVKQLETLLDNKATVGTSATIFTSEGNLGRFGFQSSSTSEVALDYVIDNLVISSLDEGPAYLVNDNFEGQTVGSKPTTPDDVRPSVAEAGLENLVVGASTNRAGTGNGVRLLDDVNASGKSVRLGYKVANSYAEQYSGLAVEFSVAPFTTTNLSKYLKVSVGEYDNGMSSSSGRFLDCRLYADGTVDFRGASGGDYNNVLAVSNNTIGIYVNDYDNDSLIYVGPDASTNSLAANTVAYWLNGTKEYETTLLDRATDGGTVLTSTNNIGRFAIVSGSSDIALDYIIDDVKIRELSKEGAPPPPANLLEETFESQTVGQQPTGAYVRPTSNTPSNLVEVVDSSVNIAGTGNGVRYLSDDPTDGGRLIWAYATGTNNQFSALRVDLNLAPLDTSTNLNGDIRISMGQYNSTLSSHAQRYINCRAFGNGKIAFDSRANGTDTGVTNAVDLLVSNNTLTIIVNDYDAQSVDYTGLDAQTYSLPPNSVAYWLNGSLQTFSGTNYTPMDVNDPTQGGTVGTSENNLGSFGFATATTFTDLDYVFDNIVITTNILIEINGYADWVALYPELGTSTNLTDDMEHDGLNNLLEYALGGDPTVADADRVTPVAMINMDGGTNWLNYVYSRRVDQDLTFNVYSTRNLVFEDITNATEYVGASDPDNGFETATNRVSTETENQQFMQLQVEL